MINNDQNTFSTTDLCFVATITLEIAPIKMFIKEQSTDSFRQQSPQFVFVFKKTPKFEKYERDFYANKIKVEPLAFFNNLKAIKSRMYSHNSI